MVIRALVNICPSKRYSSYKNVTNMVGLFSATAMTG